MPQAVRNRRLDGLRKGKTRILVATDVAARGIDVSTITHVFNYGLPMKAEDYVHRIGRTGRAGKTGVAVTFARREDAHKVRQIERYINSKIEVTVLPGLEPKTSEADFRNARVKPASVRRGKGAPKAGAGRRHSAAPSGRSDWSAFGGGARSEFGARTAQPRAKREGADRTGASHAERPARSYPAGHALAGVPRSREGAKARRAK